jgi:hypothetical protein
MAELLGLDMSLPPGSQHYVTARGRAREDIR